jgi:hypothetical protein
MEWTWNVSRPQTVPSRGVASGFQKRRRLKGFQFLIPALARIQACHHTLMLYIVANGYARAELDRLVRDLGVEPQVRFVGATPNEELTYWYSAADMQLPGQLERRLAQRLARIHGLWHARGCNRGVGSARGNRFLRPGHHGGAVRGLYCQPSRVGAQQTLGPRSHRPLRAAPDLGCGREGGGTAPSHSMRTGSALIQANRPKPSYSDHSVSAPAVRQQFGPNLAYDLMSTHNNHL